MVRIEEGNLPSGDIFVIQAALCAYFALNLRADARLCTTTTPVPVLLVLREAYDNGGVDDIKFMSIEPCDDYIGVDQMVVTST